MYSVELEKHVVKTFKDLILKSFDSNALLLN